MVLTIVATNRTKRAAVSSVTSADKMFFRGLTTRKVKLSAHKINVCKLLFVRLGRDLTNDGRVSDVEFLSTISKNIRNKR